jgi:hypothetical protein
LLVFPCSTPLPIFLEFLPFVLVLAISFFQ